MSEEETNYFQEEPLDPTGMRYRLEGEDVIESVVTAMKGGLIKRNDGSTAFNERYRLMNDEGISRVELFLKGGVNKINHLTKYKNEGRILQQMRSLVRSFTIELVENLKRWAPNAETVTVNGGEELINPSLEKVRNKHFILQVVENGIFQSMQRGGEGFEAELTGKSWNVLEQVGQQPEQRRGLRGGRGFFGFGRREGEYD